jgi:hypothetical protein
MRWAINWLEPIPQSGEPARAHLCGKLAHGFLRNLAAFTTCHGGAGFGKGGSELNTSPLTLFPQRKCFFNRFFLAPQTPRLYGVAGECSLIGCKLDFHCFGSWL